MLSVLYLLWHASWLSCECHGVVYHASSMLRDCDPHLVKLKHLLVEEVMLFYQGICLLSRNTFEWSNCVIIHYHIETNILFSFSTYSLFSISCPLAWLNAVDYWILIDCKQYSNNLPRIDDSADMPFFSMRYLCGYMQQQKYEIIRAHTVYCTPAYEVACPIDSMSAMNSNKFCMRNL